VGIGRGAGAKEAPGRALSLGRNTLDACVRVQDVRGRPVDASRESSTLPETHSVDQNSVHKSVTSVDKPLPALADAQSEPVRRPLPLPPGDFVSAEYASDCARFIAESKNRARRRAEAGIAFPSVAF
jgi:hypothetical protein